MRRRRYPDEQHRRRSMTTRRNFTLGAASLWLAAAVAGSAWGSHGEVFFAAPGSGEKVREYEVALRVRRDETRSFSIPGGCPDAMQAYAAGAAQWCSRLEKHLWQKVAADCRYDAFLHRFSTAHIEDAVSDFDFRNAAIGDLLVSFACPGDDAEADRAGCAFLASAAPDIAPLLSFAEPGDDTSGYDADACRFEHGSFRGHVLADATGLRCRADPRAPGIRVLSVDYAEVNGDGWLDAVLRVVPIGPGAHRRPLVLTYTRIGPGAALSVPEEGPSPLPAADGNAPPRQSPEALPGSATLR